MLPDSLIIMDYSVGHTSSIHDAFAFQSTRIFKEHERILAPGKWIWADLAYPAEMWYVAPFRKPKGGKLSANQRTYNYHILKVSPYSFFWYLYDSQLSRSAYALSMQSGCSKATSKHSTSSRFKLLHWSITNGWLFLFNAVLSYTIWYLDLRVGTLTPYFTSTSTRPVEDAQHQGSPMWMTTTTHIVVTMECRRLGNIGKQKDRGFSGISWHGCSVANWVEQSDGLNKGKMIFYCM